MARRKKKEDEDAVVAADESFDVEQPIATAETASIPDEVVITVVPAPVEQPVEEQPVVEKPLDVCPKCGLSKVEQIKLRNLLRFDLQRKYDGKCPKCGT